MEFDDLDSLFTAISVDLYSVVEDVAKHIKNELKNNIEDIVYNPYNPVMYKRLGEVQGFLGSWWEDPIEYDSDAALFSTIRSHPESMLLDPPHHGSMSFSGDIFMSVLSGGQDRRKKMPEIIMKGTHYDFRSKNPNRDWWTAPRDYWTPTIELLNKGGIMDNLVPYFFSQQGIGVKRI